MSFVGTNGNKLLHLLILALCGVCGIWPPSLRKVVAMRLLTDFFHYSSYIRKLKENFQEAFTLRFTDLLALHNTFKLLVICGYL